MHPKPCPDMPIDDFNVSDELRAQLKQAGFHTVKQVHAYLERTMGCRQVMPENYQHISFWTVLKEMKNLGCWPDSELFEAISIKELDIEEKCINGLSRTGVFSICDLITLFEMGFCQPPGAIWNGRWLGCFDEIIADLQAKGYWPQCPDK